MLSFFTEGNYNIFCSEIVHTDRVHHYLRPCILFGIFEKFEIKKFEVLKTNSKRATLGVSGSVPFYILKIHRAVLSHLH
jgi:hypothetical protein